MTSTPRDPAIAAVLSFFLSGAGAVYNGRIGKGVVIFGATVLGYFLIIPGLILHLWAIYDAWKEAERINRTLAEGPALRSAAPTRSAAPATGAEDLVAKLAQLQRLRAARMLTDGEFAAQKAAVLSRLAARPMHGDPTDLLVRLLPLKEAGVLDDDDVARLKRAAG
ncbi:MAG TPA: hypothetical protein VEI02_14155 [Planctomycetota bacterium]|nr:hypothetical protein [Planctomycetota bacterium]